jgi:NADP-dependent 3-hydroxy acid dehydrogenase YdfG
MRVLLTGVTSGIGRALAQRLVRGGHEVWGLGRRADALHAIAAELGTGFRPLCGDLSRPEAVAALVDGELAEAESFDALINNAALCVWARSLELGDTTWSDLLQVNLLSVVTLTRAVVPRLVPGGQVINISSVAADFVAHPAFGPYALTKAALDHFTDSLRLELSSRGLRVCSIAPGLVDTEIYSKVDGFERMEERLRKGVPTWLSSEDLAETLEWVLSRPPHVQIAKLAILPTGQPR